MKYIRNFLILLAIVVNSDSFCMSAQQIANQFIAQDSRIAGVPIVNHVFGSFLSDIPAVEHTALREGAVNQYIDDLL